MNLRYKTLDTSWSKSYHFAYFIIKHWSRQHSLHLSCNNVIVPMRNIVVISAMVDKNAQLFFDSSIIIAFCCICYSAEIFSSYMRSTLINWSLCTGSSFLTTVPLYRTSHSLDECPVHRPNPPVTQSLKAYLLEHHSRYRESLASVSLSLYIRFCTNNEQVIVAIPWRWLRSLICRNQFLLIANCNIVVLASTSYHITSAHQFH